MTSTIRVDNFGPSAGGTTYSARGIAKAWVNFNGTGTIAARDSENVSSLTDNGTGKYTVNFTAAMANLNYAVPTGFAGNGADNFHPLLNNPLAGSVQMYGVQWGVGFYDTSVYSVSILGDLA